MSEQPIEETSLPEDEKKSREPGNKGITRRSLIKGVFAAGGLAALSKGISPKAVVEGAEYIADSGPIRFFFGNHHIPPESDQVLAAFKSTGDLSLSQWDSSTLDMVNNSMKEARQKGRPYFIMVDGLGPNVIQHLMNEGNGDENSASFKAKEFSVSPPGWLALPHPDLSRKEEYPERIYLIEGDIRSDFGLGDIPNANENYFILQGLEQLLQDRYIQKSRPEIIAEAESETESALREKLTEGAIVGAALAAGLPRTEATRRRALTIAGLLAGVGATEIGKGLLQGNALSYLIGKTSDPVDQKILTALSDTVSWKYTEKPTILCTNARTALAVEKTQEIIKNPDDSLTQPPTHIDLLYGSAHSAELSRIMSDQGYRHQLIAAFMSDVLIQIDSYLNEIKGPNRYNIQESEYKLIRSNSFKAVATGLTGYKISEINMPWGKAEISPAQIQDFENNLATDKVVTENHSLKKVVLDVLQGFGIKE